MSTLTMPHSPVPDFRVQNPRDWKRLIDGLFPIARPMRAKWEQPAQIIAVLNQLCRIPNVNHLFFPDGGGQDLLGARVAPESGLLSLNCGGVDRYVKPESLSFESFGDTDDYQWSYFRLALAQNPATGIYPDFDEAALVSEELLELGSGEYVHRSSWDENEHDGEPLSKKARLIVRILRGSLVIFQKTSLYNQLAETYLAPHNKVDDERFRKQIAALRASSMPTLR